MGNVERRTHIPKEAQEADSAEGQSPEFVCQWYWLWNKLCWATVPAKDREGLGNNENVSGGSSVCIYCDWDFLFVCFWPYHMACGISNSLTRD